MVLVQNKYKKKHPRHCSEDPDNLRYALIFVRRYTSHSGDEAGNLSPQKTDSGVFIIAVRSSEKQSEEDPTFSRTEVSAHGPIICCN